MSKTKTPSLTNFPKSFPLKSLTALFTIALLFYSLRGESADTNPISVRELNSFIAVGTSGGYGGITNSYLQLAALAGGEKLVVGSVTCGNGTPTQFPTNTVRRVTVINPTTTAVFFGGDSTTAATTSFPCIGATSSCSGSAINDIDVSNTNKLWCVASGTTQLITFMGTN